MRECGGHVLRGVETTRRIAINRFQDGRGDLGRRRRPERHDASYHLVSEYPNRDYT